ncbi:hypothetical protein C2E23DRAFT_859683 [Lenzites betulinus]|nr:hypothetical protein C2E23DRAFT_859683 [Lenzites betulinus]
MSFISAFTIATSKGIKLYPFDNGPVTCILVLVLLFSMAVLARFHITFIGPLSSLAGLVATKSFTAVFLGFSTLVFRLLRSWYLALYLADTLSGFSSSLLRWRALSSDASPPDNLSAPSQTEESAAIAAYYKTQYTACQEVVAAALSRNSDMDARLQTALALIADQNDMITALSHAQATGRMSIAVQEEVLADLHDAVATRDHTIADLKDTVTTQDLTIAELEASHSTASSSISAHTSSSSVNDKTLADLQANVDSAIPTKRDMVCIQTTLAKLSEDVGSITKTLQTSQADRSGERNDKPYQETHEDFFKNTQQDDTRNQDEASVASQLMMTINDLRADMKALRADMNDTKDTASRNNSTQAAELRELKTKNIELQTMAKQLESAGERLMEKDRTIATYKNQIAIAQTLSNAIQTQFKQASVQLKSKDAELVIVHAKLAEHKDSAAYTDARLKKRKAELVRVHADYEARVDLQHAEIEDLRAQLTAAFNHRRGGVQSEYLADPPRTSTSTPRSRSAHISSRARSSASSSSVRSSSVPATSSTLTSAQSSPSSAQCSTSTVRPYPVAADQSSFCIEDKLAEMNMSCDLVHDKFSLGGAGEDSFWADKGKMVARGEDNREKQAEQPSSLSIRVGEVSCDLLHDGFSSMHKDQDSFWLKESPVKGKVVAKPESAVSSGRGSPVSEKPSFQIPVGDVSCDLLHGKLSFLSRGDEDSHWLNDSPEKPKTIVASEDVLPSVPSTSCEDREQPSFDMQPEASFDLLHDDNSFLQHDQDSFWLGDSPKKVVAKSVDEASIATSSLSSMCGSAHASRDESFFNMRIDNVSCNLLRDNISLGKQQGSSWLGGSRSSVTVKPNTTEKDSLHIGTIHSVTSFASNLSFEFVRTSTPSRRPPHHAPSKSSQTPPHPMAIRASSPLLLKRDSRLLLTPGSAPPPSALFQRMRQEPASPSPPQGFSKRARARKLRAIGHLEPLAVVTNVSRR